MKRNFLFVAAAFFGSQLTAQQDTTVKAMDELVITANKYPNKTSLTGKVLTIISREQLERSGGKDLAQILTEQAGVYIGGANSNPGKDKSIYLRGARIDHTLITIDGVTVYDSSGIGGNFDIRNLSAANIERIEILKGSQSTLYGSDAIAGVINIITKKAGNKAMNGNAMLGYGSFNSFRGSAGINGQKEKFDYNLNYSIHKTDGINESTSNSSNAEKDGYTQHNIMAGFGIQPSKNIRIQPYIRFSKIDGDLDQGAFVDELDYTYNQEYLSIGFYGPYKTKYSSDSLNQNQLGLYAAMNFNSSCGFNIELGNRLNIHSEYGSYDVFNINPSYLINKRFKLFANFSSAYRTPSLYQLFSEYGNKDLDPESGYTLEGGMQFFSNDKKFTSRAVAFKRDVKDVIFFYYNASTFQSQYINQDKQKDNGIELEASYTIAKNTTIKAFYTYVTGEITTKKSSGKDTTFFNLLRRPKNSFGVNISSQVNEKLFVSSNLSAFGERSDRYFDSNTFQTVNATLKSYALWDVYAEYGFLKNKIKLFADLRNILDSKYTEISGFNTTGFAINGGVRLNF